MLSVIKWEPVYNDSILSHEKHLTVLDNGVEKYNFNLTKLGLEYVDSYEQLQEILQDVFGSTKIYNYKSGLKLTKAVINEYFLIVKRSAQVMK